MDVDKVAFTGSSAVGQIVSAAAAKSNLKRVTVESGGKSPLIIFPDADMAAAAKEASLGIYFNSGQVCCASSRVLVHEQAYGKFIEALTQFQGVFKGMTGDPMNRKMLDAETPAVLF